MKACSRCKITKNYEHFTKDRSVTGGYARYCRPCVKLYRQKNRKKINEVNSNYRRRNSEIFNAKYVERYNSDPLFKLKVNLRNRLNMALRKHQKSGSAVRDLGCTVNDLMKHLEQGFYPHPLTGQPMTWDNWGRGKNKWNIDHIVEFNEIDLNSTSDLKKINHYTNLRPLWHIDHVNKHEDR